MGKFLENIGYAGLFDTLVHWSTKTGAFAPEIPPPTPQQMQNAVEQWRGTSSALGADLVQVDGERQIAMHFANDEAAKSAGAVIGGVHSQVTTDLLPETHWLITRGPGWDSWSQRAVAPEEAARTLQKLPGVADARVAAGEIQVTAKDSAAADQLDELVQPNVQVSDDPWRIMPIKISAPSA